MSSLAQRAAQWRDRLRLSDPLSDPEIYQLASCLHECAVALDKPRGGTRPYALSAAADAVSRELAQQRVSSTLLRTQIMDSLQRMDLRVPGDLHSVRALRERVRASLPQATREAFDNVALELQRDGSVVLHHTDLPRELERATAIFDQDNGIYYVGIAPRRA